jgi:2-polyprenyl-6-methoxyphenol hydroxylase-like FAD-dependent oxidoreductase
VKAIIVDRGIGGLSTAIALRRVGVEATVCERTGKLGEIGAGISLWANAMKALRKLGLYDAVRRPGGLCAPAASYAPGAAKCSTRFRPARWRRGSET